MNIHVAPRGTTAVPLVLDQVAAAQPGSVAGIAVLEGAVATSMPPVATITLTTPGQPPITETAGGSTGLYALPFIPPGVYTVTASAPGYESVSVPSVVVAGDTVNLPQITLCRRSPRASRTAAA